MRQTRSKKHKGFSPCAIYAIQSAFLFSLAAASRSAIRSPLRCLRVCILRGMRGLLRMGAVLGGPLGIGRVTGSGCLLRIQYGIATLGRVRGCGGKNENQGNYSSAVKNQSGFHVQLRWRCPKPAGLCENGSCFDTASTPRHRTHCTYNLGGCNYNESGSLLSPLVTGHDSGRKPSKTHKPQFHRLSFRPTNGSGGTRSCFFTAFRITIKTQR